MRTTLDLNDALLRRAKAEAARNGTTLTRLIEEGLALRLGAKPPTDPQAPLRWKVFEGADGSLDDATYRPRPGGRRALDEPEGHARPDR